MNPIIYPQKNSGGGNPYYLFIGRIEEIKGLTILLNAFAGLPEKKLVLAGTGTEVERYKELATDNVYFAGFLNKSELSKYLSNAKAVIVPSQWYETFGMIIVEAYAAHKPVIVGNVGNIASLVEEGKTGLRFEYNSANSLSDAILQFENMDMDELQKNSYRKYQAEFSTEKNYEALKRIYDTAVASR